MIKAFATGYTGEPIDVTSHNGFDFRRKENLEVVRLIKRNVDVSDIWNILKELKGSDEKKYCYTANVKKVFTGPLTFLRETASKCSQYNLYYNNCNTFVCNFFSALLQDRDEGLIVRARKKLKALDLFKSKKVTNNIGSITGST